MIVAQQWIAAGSTATLLAGALFLGAPMASAAPGDRACLQASTQFNAALGTAGVDLVFVTQFESAAQAAVAAAQNAVAIAEAALTSEAAVAAEAQVSVAEELLLAAGDAVLKAESDLAAANDAVLENDPEANPNDDPSVIKAQQALLNAQDAEKNAGIALDNVFGAYEATTNTEAVQVAELAAADAIAELEILLLQLDDDPAVAQQLLDLFKAFLAACDAGAIGVDPVPPVVVQVPAAPVTTPVEQAPVAPVVQVPAAPGTGVKAPTGTNKGLNVQTAVATEDNGAAVALIAALLAVGVAVPTATALRMRRLERAQR